MLRNGGTFWVIFGLLALVNAGWWFWLHRETRRLRDELDRKSRILNHFVSLVAHQLRAPMTQLRWMTEHLASHPRLPKDAREMAAQIEAITRKESRLVADLLNVSRIERGVLRIELGDVALLALAKEIAEPLLARAAERNVTLSFDKSLGRARVRVDRQKAVEAVRNILDNAVNYSPDGGVVRLFVTGSTADAVTLAIADQGPGIPRNIRPTLFEIRLTTKDSAPDGGLAPASTGLGLYLTKQFLAAMGASVTYESDANGTIFSIRLPRAPARHIAPARSKR